MKEDLSKTNFSNNRIYSRDRLRGNEEGGITTKSITKRAIGKKSIEKDESCFFWINEIGAGRLGRYGHEADDIGAGRNRGRCWYQVFVRKENSSKKNFDED